MHYLICCCFLVLLYFVWSFYCCFDVRWRGRRCCLEDDVFGIDDMLLLVVIMDIDNSSCWRQAVVAFSFPQEALSHLTVASGTFAKGLPLFSFLLCHCRHRLFLLFVSWLPFSYSSSSPFFLYRCHSISKALLAVPIRQRRWFFVVYLAQWPWWFDWRGDREYLARWLCRFFCLVIEGQACEVDGNFVVCFPPFLLALYVRGHISAPSRFPTISVFGMGFWRPYWLLLPFTAAFFWRNGCHYLLLLYFLSSQFDGGFNGVPSRIIPPTVFRWRLLVIFTFFLFVFVCVVSYCQLRRLKIILISYIGRKNKRLW